MKKLYLITGASGHIGTVLIAALLKKGAFIRALTLYGQKDALPKEVEKIEGDVTVPDSLAEFFDTKGYDAVTLIHLAARISVATKADPSVWNTNVQGTRNVMQMALQNHIDRAIYVSSVHAIPEKPFPEIITETEVFSPELVRGQYAKSKAAATKIVMDLAEEGLNVSVVHPSGVIGPGDLQRRNHSVLLLHDMAKGSLPFAVKGGYDFVDARDVAEGILQCEERGRPGECYILSGRYASILDLYNMVRKMQGRKPKRALLPYPVAKIASGIAEKLSLWLRPGEAPLLTPYSVDALYSNSRFSHEKASRELGYAPRPLKDTVRDTIYPCIL